MLEQLPGRCRGAERVHADDFAVQADVFAPVVGGAGFDGDARAAVRRQHAFAVLGGLLVERFSARHGDHAHGDAVVLEVAHGVHGQADFGAGGDEDGLELAVGRVGQHVAAAGDVVHLLVGARLVVQLLARKHQAARAGVVFDGDLPADRGFHRVARTPDVVAGDVAQAGQVLDRLVGGAVFAQADGVVGVDVDGGRRN